jgi:pSer/pThr/pTyr-binding forkhead associated (FHA) protein
MNDDSEPIEAVDAQAGAYYLIVRQNHTVIAAFELRHGRFGIGRVAGNHIRIDGKYVSRFHCQVTFGSQGCVIEDLQSQNGIYFRSKRVSVHRLREGDVITLNEHTITFSREPAAVEESVRPRRAPIEASCVRDGAETGISVRLFPDRS